MLTEALGEAWQPVALMVGQSLSMKNLERELFVAQLLTACNCLALFGRQTQSPVTT